jgi:hypothetical protein
MDATRVIVYVFKYGILDCLYVWNVFYMGWHIDVYEVVC